MITSSCVLQLRMLPRFPNCRTPWVWRWRGTGSCCTCCEPASLASKRHKSGADRPIPSAVPAGRRGGYPARRRASMLAVLTRATIAAGSRNSSSHVHLTTRKPSDRTEAILPQLLLDQGLAGDVLQQSVPPPRSRREWARPCLRSRSGPGGRAAGNLKDGLRQPETHESYP